MQHLKDLTNKAREALDKIDQNLEALEEFRVEYFGKKGHFTTLMQELRNIAAEERPAIGAKINEAKQVVLDVLNAKKEEWEQAVLNAKLANESIDVSLPGRKTELGGLHPVSITIERVVKFFSELGFTVANGPEIETDYYNFDALNIPDHHPARADHDTFWFDANR
ncbi:TPA: phenylalanine--tRNA ligase subunit alpha, partial [Mannheimia haemolytica]|nr:phenylalanine--tRNA ligase subunit alpha [Mannheimia haemolytica]